MKEKILQVIKEHGGDIVVPELANMLGEKAEGNLWVYAGSIKDEPSEIVFAADVSDAFLEAFNELTKEKIIHIMKTDHSFIASIV